MTTNQHNGTFATVHKKVCAAVYVPVNANVTAHPANSECVDVDSMGSKNSK